MFYMLMYSKIVFIASLQSSNDMRPISTEIHTISMKIIGWRLIQLLTDHTGCRALMLLNSLWLGPAESRPKMSRNQRTCRNLKNEGRRLV
jgi:hypothetical protein